MRSLLALVVATAAVTATPRAGAAPLLAPHVGGPVFTGPTSPHVSSLFWNPAAIGLMGGVHVFASGSARFDQTTITRDGIDPATGAPASGSMAPVSSTPMTPTGFLGITFGLPSNRRVSAGIAIYRLYAEQLPDGPGLGYHARGGWFDAWETAMGGSIRLSSDFYIGLAVRVLAGLDMRLRYDRDLNVEGCGTARPPCGPVEDPSRAQHVDVSVDEWWDWELRVSFGALLRVQDWWIGAAYLIGHGQTSGGITRFGKATVTGGGNPSATGDVRVNIGLPGLFHFGVRRPVGAGWDILANFRWIDFTRQEKIDLRFIGTGFQTAGVPEWNVRHRGLGNAFSFEAGAENQPGERLRVGGRLRFETSAVPTEDVSPAAIDSNKLALLLGFEARLTSWLAVGAGYSLTWFLPVHARPSAYDPTAQTTCFDAQHALEACTSVCEGEAIPTAAGDYQRLSHDVTVTFTLDRW